MDSHELFKAILIFCGCRTAHKCMQEPKIDCFEYVNNCSVDRNAEIKKETFEKCKDKWIWKISK